MERLPSSFFGRTLRNLVREHWGTQARFAEAASVGNTWVTKVIRGDQESLTYPSLQKLLAGFDSPSQKDELYQAWLETYAPSPVDRCVPEVWASDGQITEYASSVHDLISAGKVLPTFKALGFLWRSLKNDPKRQEAALRVGNAYIDTANQLDRILVALEVGHDMATIARSKIEPAWMAKSLWLQGVSMRLVRPRNVARAESALADFAAYVSGWQPSSSQGRAVHTYLTQAAARDCVLCALDAVNEGMASPSILVHRIAELRNRIEWIDDEAEIGLGNEVVARALIATGRIDEAAKPLAAARALVRSKANELKVLICRIQLLASSGEAQEAEKLLHHALNLADEFSLVHHRIKLSALQQRLQYSAAAMSFWPR